MMMSCSWCTFTLQYDSNKQYITYVQLDANEAVVDKDSIETNETTGVPVRAKIDKAKVTSVYKDIKNRISSLTYAITDDMSDVEKVLLVHDWIARELVMIMTIIRKIQYLTQAIRHMEHLQQVKQCAVDMQGLLISFLTE